MIAQPKLYAGYDRRAVHDIFEPDAPFTPQTGKWGISGIIRLANYPGDFVLFVTFGKQEGAHAFDESISDTGVLRWQSQPEQKLTSRAVIDLVAHDERRHTVYLFLRTASKRKGVPPPYIYLGPLKYLGHDAQREKPAHIAWELLNWPIPDDVSTGLRLEIVPESSFAAAAVITQAAALTPSGSLAEEAPPSSGQRQGESTHTFKAMKRRYLSSEQSRDLGLKGELLVLRRELQRLVQAGQSELAEKVVHTSVADGDGAGYDISSFFPDGRPKYIEVKTTTGSKHTEFFVSPNEIAFSAAHPSEFELCRVFNYDDRTDSGSSYSVFGDISKNFALSETQYRARI